MEMSKKIFNIFGSFFFFVATKKANKKPKAIEKSINTTQTLMFSIVVDDEPVAQVIILAKNVVAI
jgi:hypothetical protein